MKNICLLLTMILNLFYYIFNHILHIIFHWGNHSSELSLSPTLLSMSPVSDIFLATASGEVGKSTLDIGFSTKIPDLVVLL